MAPTLAALLAPQTLDDFFRNHWQATPLFVARQDATFYRDVFTATGVDDLLAASHQSARPPFVLVKKAGLFVGEDQFTSPLSTSWRGRTEPVIDVPKLLAQYEAGATLTLASLHTRVPTLGLLCRELESAARVPVQANAYITPADATGGRLHFDDHDVFVLQIEGTKCWQVFAPPAQLPLEVRLDFEVAEQPLMDLTLHPGDLLYLPRGFPHQTWTRDCASIHVTIGAMSASRCWKQLVAEALDQISDDDVRFRQPITPERGELVQRYQELIAALGAVDPEPLVDRMERNFVNMSGRDLRGAFLDVSANLSIGASTALFRRANVPHHIRRSDDGIFLSVPGRDLCFSNQHASALDFVVAAKRGFTPAELPLALGLDAKIAFARELFHAKWLSATDSRRD